MNQITIVSACEVDGEGFRQRLQGRGIRDCILVLSSEGISLGLLHKELSSRTFVEDEILGREAALDIDSGRIATTDSLDGGDTKITENERTHGWDRPWRHDAAAKEKAVLRQKENVAKAEKIGRFPANLILMHDSECSKEGTKMVKNQGGKFRSNEFKKNPYSGGYKERPNTHFYFGDDGYEETDNWECVDHCPVGLLDAQSGVLGNGFRPNFASAIGGQVSFVAYEISKGVGRSTGGHNDTGGASRFFKQVTSQEELDQYLQSMVRGS